MVRESLPEEVTEELKSESGKEIQRARGRETEREELQNVDYVPVPVRQPLAITWGKSGPLGATFRPAGAFLALA